MFNALFRATINTALTPVSLVADVVTLGGALTDREEPYTVERVKQIGEDLSEVLEPLDD